MKIYFLNFATHISNSARTYVFWHLAFRGLTNKIKNIRLIFPGGLVYLIYRIQGEEQKKHLAYFFR